MASNTSWIRLFSFVLEEFLYLNMVAVILKNVVKIESLSHFIISTSSPLLHSRIENILYHKIFHSFEELLQPIGKQEQSTFQKT